MSRLELLLSHDLLHLSRGLDTLFNLEIVGYVNFTRKAGEFLTYNFSTREAMPMARPTATNCRVKTS